MSILPKLTLFPLGQIVVTPDASDALAMAHQSLPPLLLWHASGDWGNLCKEGQAKNARTFQPGGRLMSSYTLTSGQTLWMITEADRRVTTLLLPSEYEVGHS
jgi:hypothetical protein